ncbi:MAG: hypothetical protein FJ255_03670 [Phycisphaerae bacterium]|nr:hypothetical protein [Phycisphaerae bacterium]
MGHEVWFAIPSASPEMCRRNLPLWKERGYRIALLQDRVRFEAPEADRVLRVDDYRGWAWAVNRLCREVVPGSASLVVTGGDDMRPDPNHWAGQLAEQFHSRFADGFGVMQPHGDGYLRAPHYCGSPFFGRRWIDTMYGGRGPVFDGYYHNWCDNEIYWVARCMGALWSRADLSHYHEHFTRLPREQGEFRAKIDGRDRADCRLYLSRAWTGFPGHEPIGGGRPLDLSPLEADTARLAEAHWVNLYASDLLNRSWTGRAREALEGCRSRGFARVALYGAGKHTRGLGSVLIDPPVRVECIIDDDERLHGSRLWNYPIVSREEALGRQPGAVVLSSNSIEPRLWDNSAVFRDAGIPVVRMYDGRGDVWFGDAA